MNLQLAHESSPGIVITTAISPVIKKGLHKITVTRREPDKKVRVANFFLDNEREVWDFLAFLACEYTNSPISSSIRPAWEKNFLGELYA